MADLSTLAAILNGTKSDLAARNPWLIGAQVLPQVQVQPGRNFTNSLIASGLTGLAKGMLMGYGTNDVNSQYAGLSQQVLDAASKPNGYASLAGNSDLAPIAAILKMNETERQAQNADALKLWSMQNDIQNNDKFQQDLRSVVLSDPRVRNLLVQKLGAAAPAATTEVPTVNTIGAPKTYQQQWDEAYNQKLNMAVPPEQAATSTNRMLDGLLAADKASFKKADSARTLADKYRTLAATADAAVSGAGETGPMNGLRTGAAWVASQLGSADQAQKLQAQKLLAPVGMDIAQAVRQPGATSDAEMKLYMSSGPSESNTPQQNRILIDRLNKLADLNAEYADFLDLWRNQFNTSQGADAAWLTYKQSVPFWTRNQDGSIDINPARPSWQEFFRFNPQVGITQVPKMGTAQDAAAPKSSIVTGDNQSAPPPALPGETYEQYRARVNGGR